MQPSPCDHVVPFACVEDWAGLGQHWFFFPLALLARPGVSPPFSFFLFFFCGFVPLSDSLRTGLRPGPQARMPPLFSCRSWEPVFSYPYLLPLRSLSKLQASASPFMYTPGHFAAVFFNLPVAFSKGLTPAPLFMDPFPLPPDHFPFSFRTAFFFVAVGYPGGHFAGR